LFGQQNPKSHLMNDRAPILARHGQIVRRSQHYLFLLHLLHEQERPLCLTVSTDHEILAVKFDHQNDVDKKRIWEFVCHEK
jgi:hypothetical protein